MTTEEILKQVIEENKNCFYNYTYTKYGKRLILYTEDQVEIIRKYSREASEYSLCAEKLGLENKFVDSWRCEGGYIHKQSDELPEKYGTTQAYNVSTRK